MSSFDAREIFFVTLGLSCLKKASCVTHKKENWAVVKLEVCWYYKQSDDATCRNSMMCQKCITLENDDVNQLQLEFNSEII